MAESFFTKWERVIKGIPSDKAPKCPKCGSREVYGRDGGRCCLACGAHQAPQS
jgi:hypothetical protein